MPRPSDVEYMTLWHKYLQVSLEIYKQERERNAWRCAFYVACTILLFLTFAYIFIGIIS